MKISTLLLFCFLANPFFIHLSSQPSNNSCEHPISILAAADEASCTTISGTTVGATRYHSSTCMVTASDVSDVWYKLGNQNYSNGVTIKVTNFSGSGGIGAAIIFVFGSTCLEGQTEGAFNEISCIDTAQTEITFNVTESVSAAPSNFSSIRIVVWSEGGTAGQGTFDICVYENPIPNEICNNNVDDDNDGLIDCDDPDCGKPVLTQSATLVHPTCPTKDNGTIIIHANGGNLRYNMNNSGWGSTNTFTGLSPGGPYNIVIENSATGCSISEEVFLNDENCPNPTGGDNCQEAPLIFVNTTNAGCDSLISANYTNATSSSSSNGEPCFSPSYHDNDIWFQFIAPSSGAISFQHFNLPFGSYGVAVYSDCSASTYIDCKQAQPMATFTGLTPQTTYYLRVWDNDANQTNPTFQFCILEIAVPTNDLCTGAIEITCGNTYTGHTLTATSGNLPNAPNLEFCEEVFFDQPGVWYQFIGTGNNVTLDLCINNNLNTNFNAEIAVLTGDCINGMTCVKGVSGTAACQNQPTVTWSSVSGQTYYIHIDGYNPGDIGAFELSVACENTNPPACSAGYFPENQTTNYPIDSQFISWNVIDVATHYLVYVGTDGGGTTTPTNIANGIATNDKFSTFFGIKNLVNSTTYYWQVIPVNNAGVANNCPILSFTTAPPPSNDNCTNPITINIETCGTSTYSNIGANNSNGLPTSSCEGNEVNDVWFSTTMPESGNLIIQTDTTSGKTGLFNTEIEVYTGICANLTSIGCGSDINPMPSNPNTIPNLQDSIWISDNTLIGQTIYLRVWGGFSSQGDFKLCLIDPNATNCLSDVLTAQTRTATLETVRAENTITSSDTLETQANIIYVASKTITLQPNFHVKPGATFKAIITNEPCNSPSPIVIAPLVSSVRVNQQETTKIVGKLGLNVFPNPFYNQTTIEFEIPLSTSINIQLYDLNGRVLQHLLSNVHYEAGKHRLTIESQELQAGIYYLNMVSNTSQLVKR